MHINKKDVINILETIAIYMEIKGENPFKVAAYRKAAQALESDDRSLMDIGDLSKLKGIGKGTAAVIEEFIQTGESTALEGLKKEVPKGLVALLNLPGLGGKKISKLYKELQIEDMNTLRIACEENKLQALDGFGKKSEEKILLAIQEYGKRPERLPLAYMLPIANDIEQQLRNMEGIERFSRAGSLRRMRETIKDLDFIIASHSPAKVKEQLLKLHHVSGVIASGETKVSLQLGYNYEVSVDFRIVSPKEFVTTLHHFTGSKDHNVKMRQLAKERGEKISEYGVEDIQTGEIKTFADEAEFFRHFGRHYIPPEVREDEGEVEAFVSNQSLIELSDIKGDLHMHSSWSDGAYSIQEMAERARLIGYTYIAITDHSQFLRVANGLTPDRLKKQKEEIDKLNQNFTDFRILTGIEVDILPDGSLDFEDEVLQEIDVVIAAIHSSFGQNKEKIMKRLTTALESNHVDIIAHPTGRIIGRRQGYDVDLELLIKAAQKTNTALELNANPNRLDLSAKALRKAQEAGVKLVINTDAHRLDMLDDMAIGVATGKKGWLRKESVINAWDINELLEFLHNRNGKVNH